MAIIYQWAIDTPEAVRDAFACMNRDQYPYPVYEWILDTLMCCHGENEAVQLDVIGWCCDISESGKAEAEYLGIDPGDEDWFSQLGDRLEQETTVIFADADTETVYHLVY